MMESRRGGALTPEESFAAQYVAEGPKYWYNFTFDASVLWEGVTVNIKALQAFRGFFADYEFSWNRAHFDAPVLVVMGRHDYVVPHTLWDETLPMPENVSYWLLERSGHTPQMEESQEFDQLFFEWLQRPALTQA